MKFLKRSRSPCTRADTSPSALLEADQARVLRAAEAAPRDALIRNLLDDLRVPLLVLAGDLGAPVESLVVDLMDLLDAFHEAREILELRPLVVDGVHRQVDLDRFFNAGHGSSFRPSSLRAALRAN